MKIITAVITPIVFLAAIFGGMARVEPVAAQCTYNLNWTFDSSIPDIWHAYNGTTAVSYSGADGHAANGMMVATGSDISTQIELTRAGILSALLLNTDSTILSNGVTVSGWGNSDHANTSAQRISIVYTDVTATQPGMLNGPGWFQMNTAAVDDKGLRAIWLSANPVAGGSEFIAYWDDIQLSIPCENIISPEGTATPTPEPTAAPGLTVTPEPTAVLTPTATPSISDTISMITPGDGDFITVDLPGPLPIPSIEDTIDLSVFWDMDNFVGILQIVQTFFYLQTIPEFFKVFLFVMSIVIGLRVVISIITHRSSASKDQV